VAGCCRPPFPVRSVLVVQHDYIRLYHLAATRVSLERAFMELTADMTATLGGQHPAVTPSTQT